MKLLSLLMTLLLGSCVIASDASTDPRIAKLVREYDTIVLGKVVSVTIRSRDDFVDLTPFAVELSVTELMQGAPIEGGKVTVFIHSPAITFQSGKDSYKDLPCVWALKRKGNDILSAQIVFSGSHFDEKDLARLRRAIVEAHPAESHDIENSHSYEITALAFSDSGKFVASGSGDAGDSGLGGKSRIEVADARTRKTVGFLKGKLREEIVALKFLTDDSLLIVSTHKAVIWTVSTGGLKWLLESEKRCIGIGKDGKSVVYVHEQDDTIQTRDWADDKGDAVEKVERLKFWHEKYPALERVLDQEPLDRFAFSVDWTRFLTINSNAATMWDTQTGKELTSAHDIGTIASVAVSPDNASLAVGTGDGKVRLAAVAGGETKMLSDKNGRVTALAFSKDGDLLAVGRDNHHLSILKLPKAK